MKDEMLNDGYTFDQKGNWTSPYSGKVTTFQPAREEFFIVQQLGGLVHNSPMDWMRQVRSLKVQIKRLKDQLKAAQGQATVPPETLPVPRISEMMRMPPMPWENELD